jgi:hypothetical protein
MKNIFVMRVPNLFVEKIIAISFAALSVLLNIIPNAAFQMKSLKILCLRS